MELFALKTKPEALVYVPDGSGKRTPVAWLWGERESETRQKVAVIVHPAKAQQAVNERFSIVLPGPHAWPVHWAFGTRFASAFTSWDAAEQADRLGWLFKVWRLRSTTDLPLSPELAKRASILPESCPQCGCALNDQKATACPRCGRVLV